MCVRAFWLRVRVSFRSFDLGLSSWLTSGGAGREISTDRVIARGIFMIPVAPAGDAFYYVLYGLVRVPRPCGEGSGAP